MRIVDARAGGAAEARRRVSSSTNYRTTIWIDDRDVWRVRDVAWADELMKKKGYRGGVPFA